MGCSAGELGAWYYLPLVLRSYHYCHAYYCLASIVEMTISNKYTHSFQNVYSQVTLASIPYSLDITPPFEYNPPPLLFPKFCCGGIFFSNLSPPSFIHCYYVSALICPMVQVDHIYNSVLVSMLYTTSLYTYHGAQQRAYIVAA